MGQIDTASKEVKEREGREIADQAIEKQRKKEKKRKMRGKGKIGREMDNKIH